MESTKSPVYYHVTFASRLAKIRREGITPGKRRNWNNMMGAKLGSTSYVYLFTDPVAAGRWAFKMEWEFEKPAVILVLKNVEDEMENDPGAEPHTHLDGGPTWKRTAATIPPTCIERVVPMTKEIAKRIVAVTQTGATDSFSL